VAIVMAVTVWPKAVSFLLSRFEETKPGRKLKRHDQVLFVLMTVLLIAYAQITHMCGTHLWGCFIAGMSFAHRHEAHHIWCRQVKRVTPWFIRIFFAATLAWSIPIDQLFSWEAFLKGSLMVVGPCILTKVLCAPFMGEARWVIGWAMVGRAEFAYFIGIMAKSLKMIPDDLFAILIWSLVYATIFAPLIFRIVLQRYVKREKEKKSEAAEANHQDDLRHRTSTASRYSTASNVKPQRISGALAMSLPDVWADIAKEKKEQEEEELHQKLKRLEECEAEISQKNMEIQQLRAQLAQHNQTELQAVGFEL